MALGAHGLAEVNDIHWSLGNPLVKFEEGVSLPIIENRT